MSKYMSKW